MVFKKKMQSDSSLNQFNNDELFSDEPCSSCRLTINKETGRLKWCTSGNKTWRFCIKLMLLIPAILLPITIIFIALSQFQTTTKISDLHTFEDDIFEITTRNNIESTKEKTKDEDRLLLLDIKTSYMPMDIHSPLQSFQRRKRNIEKVKDSDVTENYNLQNLDEERNNFSSDYYQEIKNDIYKSNKTRDYSHSEKREIMPFYNKYESMDITIRLKEDLTVRTQEENAFSLFMNGTEMRSEIIEERDAIENDGMSNFYTFWKSEGNVRSTREARAKIMLKYMNKSVDPCQDFYQYACGNWAKYNPIPKDKANYDTFEMLRESLDVVLKELLEDPILHDTNKFDTDDATIKAKYLFQSCMNYEILEQRRERPLIQLLDQLGGWPILKPDWESNKFDWLLLTAQLRLYNNDVLITEWVGPDIKNSDKYVIQFDQTSLGLPTRDYFLQPTNAIYLEAYKDYLIKIATLLGASLDNATIHAEELIEFETQLATDKIKLKICLDKSCSVLKKLSDGDVSHTAEVDSENVLRISQQ